jgi:hypothetical protein
MRALLVITGHEPAHMVPAACAFKNSGHEGVGCKRAIRATCKVVNRTRSVQSQCVPRELAGAHDGNAGGSAKMGPFDRE